MPEECTEHFCNYCRRDRVSVSVRNVHRPSHRTASPNCCSHCVSARTDRNHPSWRCSLYSATNSLSPPSPGSLSCGSDTNRRSVADCSSCRVACRVAPGGRWKNLSAGPEFGSVLLGPCRPPPLIATRSTATRAIARCWHGPGYPSVPSRCCRTSTTRNRSSCRRCRRDRRKDHPKRFGQLSCGPGHLKPKYPFRRRKFQIPYGSSFPAVACRW